MSRAEKMLARMRNNPHGWRIEQLIIVAQRYGIEVTQAKGSHIKFAYPELDRPLIIPARKPVRRVYVKSLVLLIDDLMEKDNE